MYPGLCIPQSSTLVTKLYSLPLHLLDVEAALPPQEVKILGGY